MNRLIAETRLEVDAGRVPERLEALLPAIRDRRAEIEQARRMPLDLVESLRRTGLFALGVPRVVGGAEASPLEMMRAIELVATADGSAGWCAMVGVANNVSAGYMEEVGAREVFADPSLPTAGIAAPAGAATRVPGGVRVSGRWPFASGISHSRWLWAGCLVMQDGKPVMTPHGPEIIHVCMPAAEAEIHDTWHVSGLCGTGSFDFSVRDVFVPDRHVFALLDPAGHRSEPLYRMPALHLFVFQVPCVSLGIARAALDELSEVARTKVPTMYMAPLADKAVVHIELARAEAALGGARAFLYELAGEMWDVVRGGRTPGARELALSRIAATQAAETGASVARIANTLAGGASIYTSSSLQRHARDAEAITHHFTMAPHTWEEAGRVMLGREPIAAVF